MPARKTLFAVGSALAAILVSGGVAVAAPMTAGTAASVIAMNQKIKGNAVSITYAYMPKDGTLDIYAVDPNGKLGVKPLGQVSLTAGDHRDIRVGLSSIPKEGSSLRAVIEESGQRLKMSGNTPERSFKIL